MGRGRLVGHDDLDRYGRLIPDEEYHTKDNEAVIDPDYLYSYLISTPGQIQLRSRERGDWQREKIGFRLTELNLKDLKQVPVPLPSLAEQRRILASLNSFKDKLNALRCRQTETAAELDTLLPAILDRAFNGEL